MVVLDGDTVREPDAGTDPMPWLMVQPAAVEDQESVEEPPEATEEGLAVKLVMAAVIVTPVKLPLVQEALVLWLPASTVTLPVLVPDTEYDFWTDWQALDGWPEQESPSVPDHE